MNNKYITVTNSIILLNVIVYFLIDGNRELFIYYGLNIYFLKANLWFQPLSSMFLHANLLHLLMNMSVLYQFGEGIRRFFGLKWYLGLYFIGGIATSVLSFYFAYWLYMSHGIYNNMVGASGALCVLLGFYSYFDKKARNGIVTMIVLISFAPLLIGISVAWYAHIIGFVIGYVFAILGKRFARVF